MIMGNPDDDFSVKDVIETLNLLLSLPTSSGNTKIEPTRDPFLQYLQQNLDRLNEKLSGGQFHCLAAALKERLVKNSVSGTAGEWQYVNCILQLLYLLSHVLLRSAANDSTEATSTEAVPGKDRKPKRPQDAPPLAKDALSVMQLNLVKNALQFVVCLGICPNLVPGVGIPLQHRSKLITLGPLDAAALADISQSSECNRARLSICVSVLADMFKIPDLQSVIVSSHLSDLLAALLQLLYAYPSSNRTTAVQKDTGPKATNQDTPVADKGKRISPPAHHKDSASCQPADVSSVNSVDESSAGAEKKECDQKGACEEHLTTAKDHRELHRETLDCVMTTVKPVSLIRELMVLQAGVPKQIQIARNPGCTVVVPPGWLKKGCSHLLFSLAKGPQGIQHLYEALSTGSDPNSPSTWRHCSAVAKIISGYPVPTQSLDQYITNISRQLADVLHLEGKDAGNLTRLLGAVSSAMTIKYKEQFFRHFHRPLLQPLLSCLESCTEKVDRNVAVSEVDLTQCLQNLHKVYIRGQPPQSDILHILQPVLTVLWTLFCVTHSAVYNIKQWVRDLLVSYLKLVGHSEAAVCLRHLCVGQGQSDMSLIVHFEAGSMGGLQAVYAVCENACGVSDEGKVAAVISILQDLKKDGVAGELLVILLKEMTEMISKESQQADIVLPTSVLRSEVREEKKGEIMRRVTLLHLLASICETFGSECLSDNTQILLFVKASLERGVAVCCGTSEEEMAIFETETMSMAMGLLTAVMAGAIEMKDSDRKLMDEMLPLLEVIGQGHPDEFIREMASDIRIAIATRGAVWSLLQQNQKGENKNLHRKTEHAAASKPTEKVMTQSSGAESSLPLREVSSDGDFRHQTRTQPPLKPLIEVLSEQPSSDSEDTRIEKPAFPVQRSVPSKPLIELVSDEASSASGVSAPTRSKTTDTFLSPGKESSGVLNTNDSEKNSSSGVSSTLKTGSEAVSRSVESGEQSLSDQISNSEKEQSDTSRRANQSTLPNKASAGGSEQLLVSKKSEKSPLQTVFEELCDPLLPVRGHALIALARLVQEKDAETLSQKDVVQKVFEENLQHGDSYLYLAAINGMSALSDCFPESVLHSLVKEFAGLSKSDSRLTAEHRMKVGEALMKATRNLGEMIPVYRELLLGAILTGARDHDAIVRASSVSNLAEVCSLLRFSLGSVLHEVLHCCSSLLETDEAIVRRAAAMALAKILEGLGSDCFTVLESALPSLYRLLKKVCAVDEDEAVQLHINLALDQLDKVTRGFAFPKQTLQKKIQVLSNEETFR